MPTPHNASIPDLIAALTETVTQLERTLPEGDEWFEDVPAWSGHVLMLENRLGTWRRGLERDALEETGGAPIVAAGWQIRNHETKRWLVNLPRVVKDIGTMTELPLPAVLGELQRAGAVVLDWKITKLREVLAANGLLIDEKKDGSLDDVESVDGPHAARVTVRTTPTRERIDGDVEK